MNLSNEIIQYISTLEVGQGRYAGKPFHVLPWQKRFIRGAFHPDNKGDAGLSVARGNGKSTLVAAIACAFIDGPLGESERMAECNIYGPSFDVVKGSIFRHISNFLKPTYKKDGIGKNGKWRIQDSANRATIENRITGNLIRVLGSNPKTHHGGVPKLALIDELSQFSHGTLDASLAAIRTARGKLKDSKAVYLGTRPDSESHPFERFLNSGSGYRQIHAVDKEKYKDKLFWRSTWKIANPSLSHFPDLLDTLIEEARDAKKDPAEFASFLSLRLNAGTPDTAQAVLLPVDVWQNIEIPAEAATGLPGRTGAYVLGVDLGGGVAMSAAAGFWPDTSRLEGFATIGAIPNLSERGRIDGVGRLYIDMNTANELIPFPGRVPDIDALLYEAQSRWGYPACVVSDRWKYKELADKMEECNFPSDIPLVARGMGFKDGSADLREFKRAVLRGAVAPVKSLLMRAGMSEARIAIDPAGNQKLAKGKQAGRRFRAKDDIVCAAILAVSHGVRIRRAERDRDKPIGIVTI